MNISALIPKSEQAELDAPAKSSLKLFRPLFVLFLFSFCLDYKDLEGEFGAATGGGSLFQFAFLGLALSSGGLATLIGIRHLLVKPGIFVAVFWWSYLAYSLIVALLYGNSLGHILRLSIPPLLVGLGINVTLIVAATGMRPGEAVRWFLTVGIISCTWRFIYGAAFSDVPLSEVRMMILSPSIGFLFAWTGCALLLRLKFTWWTLLIFGVPMFVAVISVTRSLVLPIASSFCAGAICMCLGMSWKIYGLKFPFKKMVPMVAISIAGAFVLLCTVIVQPTVLDSWNDRLFHNRGASGATTEDLSTLMRKAEAVSMWTILKKDPFSFIYGKGLGAPYYWDESFYPELFLVYPNDRHQFPLEIYSAGHSIWTYTVFSRGFIGILYVLVAIFGTMALSIHSARLNSLTVMGPRAWDSFLMFLPFVTMWAILSESITRNPFDERLTGPLFGFMMALPQFFYNRSFYLDYRESVGKESEQILLDESLVPDEFSSDDIPERTPQFQAST